MKRVPITGTRLPVTGIRQSIVLKQREPIHQNPALKWDDVYGKYNNYIKFAAKNVSDNNPNMYVVSAEDLYQEGLLLLWKCFEQYQFKLLNEFGYIFKASVWRHLRGLAAKTEIPTTDIDEAFDVGEEDDTWDRIWEEHRMKQVIDLLKDAPIAIDVLYEFLNPSISTFKQCEADMARKEMVKSQGYRVNVPTSIEVKGTHIQRALNLSKEIYMENLKLIQKAVYKVYSPDVTIRNYIPNSDELVGAFDTYTEANVMTAEPALENSEVRELVNTLSGLLGEALNEETQEKDIAI